MKKPFILLIDDDDSLRRVMEFSLVESGYRVQTAASGEDGLRLLEKDAFDAVITDITMPGMSGMEVLARIHEREERLPVVVITAYGTIESAVEAMKKGAFDYITKPFNRDELRLTLHKALRMRRLEKENVELRAEITDRYRFESIIGVSEKIKDVLSLAGRVAASDASVLITGESGTGKELLAKGIHYNSPRADGPFVAVTCAAIPENLIESELFGYKKGAFPGAAAAKIGLVDVEEGGSVLADEVGGSCAAGEAVASGSAAQKAALGERAQLACRRNALLEGSSRRTIARTRRFAETREADSIRLSSAEPNR